MQPLVDYQKSILFTQKDHIRHLEEVAQKKEANAAEKEKKQLEKESTK